MQRLLNCVVAAGAAFGLPARLAGQTVTAEGVRVRVTGYAQIQFNTTSVDEEAVTPAGEPAGDLPFSTFETRRIRPVVDVTVADWISGRIQPDLALGRLRLADAYMNFGFGEALQLRVGQFKKPFSLLFLRSSTLILPIERAVRIRGLEEALEEAAGAARPPVFTSFRGELVLGEEQQMLEVLGYAERDLGAAIHGRLGRVGYEAGVFNGGGADRRDDNDDKSIAARVSFQPIREATHLLGAAVSRRETRIDGRLDGREVHHDLAGTVFGIDAEWGEPRRPGLHFMLEGVVGDNLAVDESLVGGQAVVAYFRPRAPGRRVEGIEPIFRLSYGDPNRDREDDDGLLLTPGVNFYFYGRNRLLFNWDFFLPAGDRFESASAFRAQAQLYY
ncbi:MAG: hypothetical protein HY703_03485 [Gemmatimonadetes bacterium]|nr:hypothetical protein [Gemmatimonadota bacterium]